MATTEFTNNVTLTDADWFNDLDRLHYDIFGDPATAAAAFTSIKQAASDTATGVIEIAIQSEMEAGSSTSLAVTPGRQHFHPGSAKGWAKANTAGGAEASYNVTSITDAGVGNATCNWATDFSSAAYAPIVQGWSDTTGWSILLDSGTGAGATNAVFRNSSATDTDPNYIIFIAFGDQA